MIEKKLKLIAIYNEESSLDPNNKLGNIKLRYIVCWFFKKKKQGLLWLKKSESKLYQCTKIFEEC